MSTSFERVAAAVTAIHALQSIDELQDIYDAVKQKQTYLARQNIRKVVKGATVRFTARAGREVVGTVTKVNRKTVVVHEAGYGNWRVPASLLTVEEYAPSAEAVGV